jgi:hypothetical protein
VRRSRLARRDQGNLWADAPRSPCARRSGEGGDFDDPEQAGVDGRRSRSSTRYSEDGQIIDDGGDGDGERGEDGEPRRGGKRGSRRSRGSLSGDGEAASGSSGGDSASEGASEYEVDEHGNRVRRRKHRSSSRRSEADGEAGLAADGEGGVDGTMGLGDDGKGGQTLSRREREKLKLKESAHFTYNFVPPHLQDADWERGLFPPSDAMVLGNGARWSGKMSVPGAMPLILGPSSVSRHESVGARF